MWPSLHWESSRYSAILPVLGLMAWPRKAKYSGTHGNVDCGARASSRRRVRAHVATCWRCFERVPCVWGATTRAFGPGAKSFLGWIVLAGRVAVEARLCRRRRRRCFPGAPVLLPNVAPVTGEGSGANVTPLGWSLGEATLRGGWVSPVGTGSTLRDASGLS